MKLFIGLILMSSFSVFAETKLECYQKFHNDIEKLDSVIIKAYGQLFLEESTLLDQYFNPGNYYRGPHVPYKAQIKYNILNGRESYKYYIDQKLKASNDLSRELAACLKYSKR